MVAHAQVHAVHMNDAAVLDFRDNCIFRLDSAPFNSAGMPVPVARKLLQDSNRLVAKAVTSADEAAAAAAGGVNVLFLQVGGFGTS